MQVWIEPSMRIRKDYNKVSKLCWDLGAPIFLTKNGQGDLAAVSVEYFFQRESRIELRESLVDIEKNRRKGVKDLSTRDVCQRLFELIENYKLLKLTEENEYPARDGDRIDSSYEEE